MVVMDDDSVSLFDDVHGSQSKTPQALYKHCKRGVFGLHDGRIQKLGDRIFAFLKAPMTEMDQPARDSSQAIIDLLTSDIFSIWVPTL